MTPEQWVLAAGVVVSFLGAVGVLLRVQHDRSAGVSTNERSAKAEERADWAAFAAEYRQALENAQRQVGDLGARLDALQVRLEEKDAEIRKRDDFIDALEHHIWRGYGPPPPARPAGI